MQKRCKTPKPYLQDRFKKLRLKVLKKKKKSVSTKFNRKNNEKKLLKLPSKSFTKSKPGFLNKKKKFRLGRSLTKSKTLPKQRNVSIIPKTKIMKKQPA